MEISQVSLEGQYVRLEPLSPDHEQSLIAAAGDGELWNSTVTIVPSRDGMAAYIASTLSAQSEGRELHLSSSKGRRARLLDAHGFSRSSALTVASKSGIHGYPPVLSARR